MIDPIVENCCINHPAQVAGMLRGQDQEEVEEFLASLQPLVASRVLAQMGSQQMASCVSRMDAGALARIVACAGHEDSTEIIAHLPSSRYEAMLSADSDHAERLSTRLYSFSKRTLGAIANPEFIRVKRGRLCLDVKQELMAGDRDRDAPVYLVDDSGLLLGLVPLIGLIADKNAYVEVDTLALKVSPLSDRMTVKAALAARQWSGASILPVVDSAQRLIGTVSRKRLLRLATRDGEGSYSVDQLAGDLALQYMNTCASLMDLLIPGPPPK